MIKARKTIILLIIAALIAGALYLKLQGEGVQVRAVLVKKQLLELTVTATSTGTIRSESELKVSAERAGTVERLNVIEGSAVRAGEVIAELDSTEALMNVGLTEAAQAGARAMLDELKASLLSLQDEAAAAELRALAARNEARSSHERLKGLQSKGYVSQVELDAAFSRYEIARADLDAARAGKGVVEARKNEIRAREAAVRESASALGLARLNYRRSFISVGTGGVVTMLPVKLGEAVAMGSLIAQVVALDSLYIEAFIDEADVGKVEQGQEVYVTMDAYPERTFTGEVYLISPVVLGSRNETRTFEVRVRFIGDEVPVKLGMSADVEIIVRRLPDTLSVPTQAVIERDGKKLVYLIEASRAIEREVTTGASNWTLTEITEGLADGDRVVSNPDVKGLEPGAALLVQD